MGRTIRKHAEGVLAYLDTKMTNGPVEGINNKLRVIARRAYGFHSPAVPLLWRHRTGAAATHTHLTPYSSLMLQPASPPISAVYSVARTLKWSRPVPLNATTTK